MWIQSNGGWTAQREHAREDEDGREGWVGLGQLNTLHDLFQSALALRTIGTFAPVHKDGLQTTPNT